MPHVKYGDKEMKEILQGLTVLTDSREQKNKRILDYFDSKKIKHQSCKLDSGDYSALLPAMPEYGITQPLYFDGDIVIERKNSLEELSGNFTKDRARIEDEFIRLAAAGTKVFLMVENPAGYDGIWDHSYRTQYEPKSFMATLLSFQQRYNLNVAFISPDRSGLYIANLLHYHVREYLKGGGW